MSLGQQDREIDFEDRDGYELCQLMLRILLWAI